MGIYIGEGTGQDYSAMRGPCPVGYHVPMPSERQAILDDLTALGYTTDAQKGLILSYYLKIPVAGSRDYTGTISHNNNGYYRCCKSTNSNRVYRFGSTTGFFNYYKGYGFSIRPFKDVPVVPDSNWTVEQQGTGDAGIFSNATLGLVSISGDGTNWVTIADKNIGATQVFQYLSGLTEDNCGKYFQRGNNNGFAWDGSVTTSSTQVDASDYGPGNYYNSSTFITQQSWDSSNNDNLWGGVTGIVKFPNVEEIFVGEGTLVNDYSAMRGPCPVGFHVPSKSELQTITNTGIAIGAWNSDGTGGGNMLSYLKIPLSGYHATNIRGAGTSYQDKQAYLWCCTATSSYYGDSRRFGGTTSTYNDKWKIETYVGRGSGNFIRPIKDVPAAPDGNWTTLYNGSSTSAGAGIFHNPTLGLISISSDGTNWTTIADKNLGATVVYNSGDTLSESNCGGWFQWGNNYMFPFSDSFTYDTEQVDATNYGPGNYYSSSTYIGNGKWDTSNNKNLRGGETGVQQEHIGNVIEVYQGTTKIRPLTN